MSGVAGMIDNHYITRMPLLPTKKHKINKNNPPRCASVRCVAGMVKGEYIRIFGESKPHISILFNTDTY